MVYSIGRDLVSSLSSHSSPTLKLLGEKQLIHTNHHLNPDKLSKKKLQTLPLNESNCNKKVKGPMDLFVLKNTTTSTTNDNDDDSIGECNIDDNNDNNDMHENLSDAVIDSEEFDKINNAFGKLIVCNDVLIATSVFSYSHSFESIRLLFVMLCGCAIVSPSLSLEASSYR